MDTNYLVYTVISAIVSLIIIIVLRNVINWYYKINSREREILITNFYIRFP